MPIPSFRGNSADFPAHDWCRTYNPADDTIATVATIAAYIGKTERQTNYLLEKRVLPGFKLGGKWHLRKSRYLEHLSRLEAEAANPEATNAKVA